jgi:hypothetical protein
MTDEMCDSPGALRVSGMTQLRLEGISAQE